MHRSFGCRRDPVSPGNRAVDKIIDRYNKERAKEMGVVRSKQTFGRTGGVDMAPGDRAAEDWFTPQRPCGNAACRHCYPDYLKVLEFEPKTPVVNFNYEHDSCVSETCPVHNSNASIPPYICERDAECMFEPPCRQWDCGLCRKEGFARDPYASKSKRFRCHEITDGDSVPHCWRPGCRYCFPPKGVPPELVHHREQPGVGYRQNARPIDTVMEAPRPWYKRAFIAVWCALFPMFKRGFRHPILTGTVWFFFCTLPSLVTWSMPGYSPTYWLLLVLCTSINLVWLSVQRRP